jgi:hypothetical protein
MNLGISTLLFRDQPLDKALFQTLQESAIESVELTDYHPGFAFDDVAYFEALGAGILVTHDIPPFRGVGQKYPNTIFSLE